MFPTSFRVAFTASLAAAALTGAGAATAAAAPLSCPRVATPITLADENGAFLESIAFDGSGRLLFTNAATGTLRAIDGPTTPARTVVSGLKDPGGLLVEPGTTRAWVTSNNAPSATYGQFANLWSVDLGTGVKTLRTTGLAMGNGLVRTSGGIFYASETFYGTIDRIVPGVSLQNRLYTGITGANGLALSPDERFLYVAQMLPPGGVRRIELATRANGVFTHGGDQFALLDGLTIDAGGWLYAAAGGPGEIWRISPAGDICVVARGIASPTAVAIGRPGRGALAADLFVTTQKGKVVRLPGAADRR